MARETTKIVFSKRENTGKGVCRKLRAKGTVPAVFYGPGYRGSLVGTVNEKEISRVANSANWETEMIDLELPDGKTEMALLRSVQRHATRLNILHIDLYQLVSGQKVRVAVPIRLQNREICAGVKMGGVLDQPMRELEMMVLPREIPSELFIDVAKMGMGDEIFVRDLKLPESAEHLVGEDEIVTMVIRPRSMVEAVEEEEPAEVEVVGKGKRKDEED